MSLKKTFSLLLAVIMVLSLLAACSQDAPEVSEASEPAAATTAEAADTQTQTPAVQSEAPQAAEESQPAQPQAEPAPPAKEERKEISYPIGSGSDILTYWTGWDQSNAAGQESISTHVVFAEVEKATGVHIDFEEVNFATRSEAFNLMIAAGDYADMLSSVGDLYSGGAAKAIADDVIIVLNDYIEENAPLYMALLDSNPNYKKSAVDDDGIFSQLFTYKSEFAGNGGWMIRQDWLDELNLQAPETYSQWENVLTQMKNAYDLDAALLLPAETNGIEGGYGVSGFSASTSAQSPMQQFFQEDGVVKSTLLEPGYKDYLTMLNDWYSKGLISANFFAISSNPMMGEIDELILNNRSAIFTGNQFYITFADRSIDPDYKISALKDPVMNEGELSKFGSDRTNLKAMDSVAISNQCDNVELALQWLNYWFTDDGIMLANYGIEGLTYDYVDGEPQFSEFMTNNPDGYSFSQMSTSYTYEHMPTLINPKRAYSTFTDDEVTAIEVWKNASTGENVLPSNITMTTAESNEFAEIFPDISTYASEKVLKYIMGEESFDTWDGFIADLKAFQIDRLIEIAQASFNRYNAR